MLLCLLCNLWTDLFLSFRCLTVCLSFVTDLPHYFSQQQNLPLFLKSFQINSRTQSLREQLRTHCLYCKCFKRVVFTTLFSHGRSQRLANEYSNPVITDLSVLIQPEPAGTQLSQLADKHSSLRGREAPDSPNKQNSVFCKFSTFLVVLNVSYYYSNTTRKHSWNTSEMIKSYLILEFLFYL